MNSASSFHRFLLFTTTFVLGVVTVNSFRFEAPLEAVDKARGYATTKEEGSGCGECSPLFHDFSSPGHGRPGTNKVNITFQPKAAYTDEARENGIEGDVRLKVTFLGNGVIGQIQVVKGLPDGLTERAVAAAKQIKFQPASVDGKPVSRTKTFDYNFTIY